MIYVYAFSVRAKTLCKICANLRVSAVMHRLIKRSVSTGTLVARRRRTSALPRVDAETQEKELVTHKIPSTNPGEQRNRTSAR
jgi:hypothetical protein